MNVEKLCNVVVRCEDADAEFMLAITKFFKESTIGIKAFQHAQHCMEDREAELQRERQVVQLEDQGSTLVSSNIFFLPPDATHSCGWVMDALSASGLVEFLKQSEEARGALLAKQRAGKPCPRLARVAAANKT